MMEPLFHDDDGLPLIVAWKVHYPSGERSSTSVSLEKMTDIAVVGNGRL